MLLCCLLLNLLELSHVLCLQLLLHFQLDFFDLSVLLDLSFFELDQVGCLNGFLLYLYLPCHLLLDNVDLLCHLFPLHLQLLLLLDLVLVF